MDLVPALLVSVSGCSLLLVRLRRARSSPATSASARADEVSVIVPARDEAHNLPRLLASLTALNPKPGEIIVVDDHSRDGTGAIAQSFGARVVVPDALPQGLVGKPWACTSGARVATGAVLLFTDADTAHAPDSLGVALAALHAGSGGLVSVLPTHRIVAWWERLQGPFHLLLLLATRAGADVGRGGASTRRFAIGQYLMISRVAYDEIGGHAAFGKSLAEDLAMAHAVAERGRDVRVLFAPGLYQVRMYPEGLLAFIAGWRRSFRDGLRAAGASAACEVSLVIAYLLGVPLWAIAAYGQGDRAECLLLAAFYFVTAWLLSREQRHYGAFSRLSALAYPVGVALFVVVSVLSASDALFKRRVTWRGRSIARDD